MQRSDFPAYVKGLDRPELVNFMPSDTKLKLQLAIDSPDGLDKILEIIAFILLVYFAAALVSTIINAILHRWNRDNATAGEPGGVYDGIYTSTAPNGLDASTYTISNGQLTGALRWIMRVGNG